jgi:hypothetical protein
MRKNPKRLLSKLGDYYRFTAVTLVNTVVAFFVLNAILFAMFTLKDSISRNPVARRYGGSTISTVYEGMADGEGEIDVLLKETWSRRYVHEPFTEFKEGPHSGLFVNVDSSGFRITKNQGPWPPQSTSLNMFLLGGSTTFGYGVSDDETIASYLQEYLTTRLKRDVRVYNFGRGHYYSTQERILYEQLLAEEFVPQIVMFLDGLNDFYYKLNEPEFTAQFRELVDKGTTIESFIQATSFGRILRMLKDREVLNTTQSSDLGLIDLVLKRYLTNKTLIQTISEPFGVKPVFVWQPVPTYLYDLRYHPFSDGGFGQHSYSKHGYERMADLIKKNPLGHNFLWCADIQEQEKKSLYVDKVHYSAAFSKQVATCIVDSLIERHQVPMHVEPTNGSK